MCRILKPIFHCAAKPSALGPGVGLDPQRHNFLLGIPTCWYLKTLKFALPPMPNLKFALCPTRTPNVSQWNISCVGSPSWPCTFNFVWVDFISVGSRFSVKYELKKFLTGSMQYHTDMLLTGYVHIATLTPVTCF